jgi:hypothetical protein
VIYSERGKIFLKSGRRIELKNRAGETGCNISVKIYFDEAKKHEALNCTARYGGGLSSTNRRCAAARTIDAGI